MKIITSIILFVQKSLGWKQNCTLEVMALKPNNLSICYKENIFDTVEREQAIVGVATDHLQTGSFSHREILLLSLPC